MSAHERFFTTILLAFSVALLCLGVVIAGYESFNLVVLEFIVGFCIGFVFGASVRKQNEK